MKCERKSDGLFGTVCGSTVLGERGQMVVPKEARDLLGSKTGDRFVVFSHNGFLVLMPEKMMSKMIAKVTKFIKK